MKCTCGHEFDVETAKPLTHRLLCGDSTVAGDVELVMGGEKADMLYTDPPYNTGKSWSGLQKNRGHNQMENDFRDDWQEWAAQALAVWNEAIAEDCSCYWWFDMRESPRGLIANAGFVLRGTLVWVKEHFNVGRADYHSQHEQCQYFSRGKRAWCGARDQSDIRRANRVEEERMHPTQKPLSLMVGMIQQHNMTTVFDPFLGSGTTMIACENLGRRGFGIEISPGYVAVALERMTQLGCECEVK